MPVNSALWPVILLFLGALLGIASSMFSARLQQRHQITKLLIERFFQVRDEISAIVSRYATLKTDSQEPDSPGKLSMIAGNLSLIYYRYYDFIPKEVLIELNCLFVCLKDKKHRLFIQEGNRIIPLPDEEQKLYDFIKRVSLVDNFTFFALQAIRSGEERLRHSVSINCQARAVLASINKYFSPDRLYSFARYGKKTL